MTTATITLNAGSGGEKPIIDTLTTVDGAAAPAGSSVQMVKVGHGLASDFKTATAATPLPVTFPAGKNNVTIADTQADIHGQLVGVTRITQVTTKFFQQAPAAFLNITASGGATATGPTAGAAVFSTSTAVTAALLAQTPVGILYAAQYEAWAVLSGAYTAPTSVASFQRLGIYDAANGYSFGFNGLTFGLWVRVNSVDTFIAQTAWNRDKLSGAADSLFTSNNSPVSLQPTNLNMYRVRYGWYGGVSAFFEVYAPDGHWIAVHQVRTVNAQAGVNMTMPDLPMTVEVSKTASDATNLSITCGGWAAGITAPSSGANLSGQRSIAALNAAVNVPVSGIGELSFAISGTWVGTLSFQSSLDGLAWLPDGAMNGASKTFTASTTVNSAYKAAVASNRFYRVIATAWTSGSASVVYSASASASFVVAQSLITDGNNNGPVAVKPASTAAVAADPALVVALSPNSVIAQAEQRASTLHVTATAAVNTAVTATLPAPAAGLFHYITSIQVVKVYNALGVAAGAGVVLTSSNLPGNPAWITEQAAGAVGTAVRVIDYQPTTPLRSAAAATISTVAAPAQLQTIWRVNVSYFTAP